MRLLYTVLQMLKAELSYLRCKMPLGTASSVQFVMSYVEAILVYLFL